MADLHQAGNSALIPCCAAPRLYKAQHFLSDGEIDHVLALTANPDALRARGIALKHDSTGLFCELPVNEDAVLTQLARRIEDAIGMENDFGSTLRFRRYAVGESHPPHFDTYRIGEANLIATAILYLTDTEAGGETYFPNAMPRPFKVPSRKGQLVVWFNHTPDGAVDPASYHEGLPVRVGEKVTLSAFIYKPLSFAVRQIGSDLPATTLGQSADRPRFYCVNDSVPTETTGLLRQACAARDLEYVEFDARRFDFEPERQLTPGNLLYRPAVSLAACRVEQFLYAPGVATFYKFPHSIFFDAVSSPLLFQRAGLPIPRTIYCATTDRALLRAFIDQLGGLPVVVKLSGGEGGVGVMRVDSLPTLFSVLDFAVGMGRTPLLSSYIDNAVHWRVVVIGDRAAAAYKNTPETDDFRTYGTDNPDDVTTAPQPALAALAVRTVDVLQNEFGGVDILQHPSGRLYVLEANFPCYFPHAQQVAGIDLSGMMVDFLLDKAQRLKVEGQTNPGPVQRT